MGRTMSPDGWRVVFTHVNEEGVEYDVSDTLPEAIHLLEQFPNDTVVITLERS